MNCLEFLKRLDAGDVASLDAESRAHAGTCAGCGEALAHAASLEVELDRVFSEAPVAPGTGFTERLMARVEGTAQVRVAPADIVRATFAAFATPSIAAAAITAAALLGFAAAFDFDPRRMTDAAAAGYAPVARVLDTFLQPLPATGAAHVAALAGVLLAIVPLLGLLVAAAWQLGNAIGDRAPRAL